MTPLDQMDWSGLFTALLGVLAFPALFVAYGVVRTIVWYMTGKNPETQRKWEQEWRHFRSR